MKVSSRKMLMAAAAVIGLAGSATLPGAARAQTSAAEHAFQIPPQPLSSALIAFGQQAGVQFSMSADLTTGKASPGLTGRYNTETGLQRLLSDSGLTYRFTASNTIIIEKPIVGAHVLGAVQVEGVQTTPLNGFGAGSGANGSSDVIATEGTGSFTTNGANVASKTPQSLKDTPQTVTVITQERIQQQNMTDLGSALLYAPGVTLYMDSTVQPAFYSRGFTISTFQLDGGAPIELGINSNYDTVPNLAEYDSVEVLKGSDALFGGAGAPGGVVSLQRKRPLDHDQLTIEADAGSWDNYLGQVDATGPIGLDGHLRGRIVVNDQDRDFFYDDAHQNKAFAYGVLEADLGPNTLVRVGGSYERQDNTGWTSSGLPRAADGADLDLPRSTNLAPPWQLFSTITPEVFAALEHKFNKDWGLKVNFTRLGQTSTERGTFLTGLIYPNDPSASTYGDYSNSNIYNDTVQYAADATVNGSVDLFGLEQKLAIGADYSNADSSLVGYSSPYQMVPVNVFSGMLPSTLTTPPNFNTLSSTSVEDQQQWGSYVTLNIQPIQDLHFTGGVRLSNYWYNTNIALYFSGSVFPISYKQHQTGVLSPYGAVTYGLTKEISLYASYADIFQPQGSQLTPAGQALQPITGDTYEAGVKGSFKDGKLNASLAFYYTKEANQAIYYNGTCDIGFSCYLADGQVTSEGIDLEVAGEIAPGWQIQAGYDYNDNRNNEALLAAGNGNGVNSTYQTQQPKHQLKLWTSYTPSGALDHWTFGGGLRLESARSTTGSVCSNPLDTSGYCATGVDVPFAFTQNLYTVADLRVAYRFNPHWEAALNLTNIGDTRYYQTVGSNSSYNFYGEPRAFMFSFRAKY